MQFVRHIAHFLLFLSCLLPAVQADTQHGILWQIDNGHSPSSFLLGTMHSDDPRIINLPAVIRQKFQQAKSFSAELNMEVSNLLQAQAMMLLNDGRTLESMIGPQRYQQCVQLMAERGVPEMQVQRMKPWAVAAELSMPKMHSGLFLDMLLFQQASSSGKRVYGLETAQEQVNVFDAMTERQQITFLDDTLAQVNEMPAMFQTMIRLYLAGDLTGLKAYSDQLMTKNTDAGMALMQKRLVEDRNQRMVKRMQPRLEEGNAFIAVGALHLPGEQGILRLLQHRGLRVKPLY